MKMFQVKVHIRHNETLHFRYHIIIFVFLVLQHRALQVILITTVITNDPSVSICIISFFCAPDAFRFVSLVVWTLSFLDWFRCKSFVEKINNGGGRLFSTFYSLLSVVDLLVVVRSASDVMIFFSYVIPQTAMKREDHVASFELASELSLGR